MAKSLMKLAFRRSINVALTVVVGVVLVTAFAVYDASLHQGAFLTGWVLLAVMVFLALFNVRKKITMLPLGSASSWLQLHVYCGWLVVLIFCEHVGWSIPTGWLEVTLAALFVLVSGSGVVGIGLSRLLPPRLTRRGEDVYIGDERVDLFKRAELCQAGAVKFCSVCQDHHLVGRCHHRLLGFHQQQVTVVKSLLVNSGHAEQGTFHVEAFNCIAGIGPDAYACLAMHVTADKYQVRGVACHEQHGNRKRVGDDLQRPTHQLLCQFIGCAPPVKQNRLPVLDQVCCGSSDLFLLLPLLFLSPVKMWRLGRGTGVENAPVGALGNT